MNFLYNTSINIIYKAIPFLSIFSRKIYDWKKAQKKSDYILTNLKINTHTSIWFHCSSLGEYEQIKPLISHCQKNINKHIYITFFSNSGFNNLQTNHPRTTILMYPPDVKNVINNFIQTINPEKIFIAKNEIWPNMIELLYRKSVPIYLISSKFKATRINNLFYGNYYRKLLKKITKIFVQDLETKKILFKKNIDCIVSGDLRINQVIANQNKIQKYDIIKKFKGNQKLIVVGSSHYDDYKIILNTINQSNYKWIIVPHENTKNEIDYLKNKIKKKYNLWSKIENIENKDVLIIDKIGLLKYLYFYADIVYIGGGFNKGIHNSLEAAVFNKPLIFGPKYDNFIEAESFIKHKIAFAINNKYEFEEILEKSLDLNDIKNKTQDFFKKNTVNIKKIIDQVF